MERYEPKEIEPKWQKVWEDAKAFETPNPEPDETGEESHWYQLEMLPYPSGTLHMGHVLNYTMGDVATHFRRRNGWTVLRPMGFDSFGLPAENAAITEGGHPREITERNIVAIRKQMQRLGWAIDWKREISAHEVDFYRWTQWLFLQFFERGLAYRAAAPVNWCPNDQTVVAHEYVVDGRCDRCGTLVEARNLEQWFFKITAYADELLEYELPEWGEWPERTKTIQRNWIGRSEGADILFRIEELDEDIPVFTTRPDTLFGATFFVLAPEHPLVERIGNDEVREYAKRTAARRGEARAAEETKTGVFTGHHVTNPVNGERLPVYVADYVLMEYGTGAIMAVPAHDERDREFAEAFDLPIREVIDEDAVLVDSGEFTGLPAEGAKRRIVEWLGEGGKGQPAVSYRLRDWSFSRQRYWGCPIPVVHCEDCGIVAVPEDELPVLLPEVDDYRPKGVPPLASNEEWVNVPCPKCGKPARREADTMDTFVDSS
ncbi:MAG: leucyl-tRNA synthetase, partial [Gaiellaceae bacterium]|nr:leucyl-tRNA synthetase [Gaiellaceae bacterium]